MDGVVGEAAAQPHCALRIAPRAELLSVQSLVASHLSVTNILLLPRPCLPVNRHPHFYPLHPVAEELQQPESENAIPVVRPAAACSAATIDR